MNAFDISTSDGGCRGVPIVGKSYVRSGRIVIGRSHSRGAKYHSDAYAV